MVEVRKIIEIEQPECGEGPGERVEAWMEALVGTRGGDPDGIKNSFYRNAFYSSVKNRNDFFFGLAK